MTYKPLGHRSYGSIPHFYGSRLGPSDSTCSEGHQRIMTEKTRDYKDLIIVQEKLDGSNCSVAKINGCLVALTRGGFVCKDSKFSVHHYFNEWFETNLDRFNSILKEGERISGEWIGLAVGTRYKLIHEPFVAFDIFVNEHNRITYHEFLLRVLPYKFIVPRLIHIGNHLPLKKAISAIDKSGHGAIDPVEGVVYRCERDNKVEFLCKWVRPDKIDGFYFDKGEVFNTSDS